MIVAEEVAPHILRVDKILRKISLHQRRGHIRAIQTDLNELQLELGAMEGTVKELQDLLTTGK